MAKDSEKREEKHQKYERDLRTRARAAEKRVRELEKELEKLRASGEETEERAKQLQAELDELKAGNGHDAGLFLDGGDDSPGMDMLGFGAGLEEPGAGAAPEMIALPESPPPSEKSDHGSGSAARPSHAAHPQIPAASPVHSGLTPSETSGHGSSSGARPSHAAHTQTPAAVHPEPAPLPAGVAYGWIGPVRAAAAAALAAGATTGVAIHGSLPAIFAIHVLNMPASRAVSMMIPSAVATPIVLGTAALAAAGAFGFTAAPMVPDAVRAVTAVARAGTHAALELARRGMKRTGDRIDRSDARPGKRARSKAPDSRGL